MPAHNNTYRQLRVNAHFGMSDFHTDFRVVPTESRTQFAITHTTYR